MTQPFRLSLRVNRFLTSLGCVGALLLIAGCRAPLFHTYDSSESTPESSAEDEVASDSSSPLPRPNFPPMVSVGGPEEASTSEPKSQEAAGQTSATTSTEASPQGASPQSPSPSSGNSAGTYQFNPSQIQVGDRLLGLDVVSTDVSAFGSDAYVGTVSFSGNITVQGTYSPQTQLVGSDRTIPCFFVNDASNSQLPRFENDERRPWFCFTNPEAVQAAFGQSTAEQEATIVIDSYTTVYIPSDVYNEARFVRLVNTQATALQQARTQHSAWALF